MATELKGYYKAVLEWKRQENIYENLKSLVDATGLDYSKPRVQTSPKDNMASTVARLIAQEEKLNNAKQNAVDTYLEIADTVERLENEEEKRVLINRYLDVLDGEEVRFKDLLDVAMETGISERKVYDLHKMAVRHYEKM